MPRADATETDLSVSQAANALKTIEAQRQADETVRRLVAGELDSEGLALALANAYGVRLQALARALTKAARGQS